VVGGLGVLNPLGWKDDILGIGFAWGEPADTAARDQYLMELYLRHQLTPKIKITPGFQLILDPSFNRDDDVIGIFELRVRVVL
jgi:carbohydrate-selective porin OprB